MTITINRNKYLSMTITGLIAVGYADIENNENEGQELIRLIRNTRFDEKIINYFEKAKSRKSIYNPFYPNGSFLKVASLYIDDYNYMDFEKFKSFIAITGVSTKYNDQFDWVYDLPEILKKISQNKHFTTIIDKYNKILDSRETTYKKQLAFSSKILTDFSPRKHPIYFASIPVRPYSVDYVKQDNTTIIISEFPDCVSILHEYLHPFVAQYQSYIKKRVSKVNFNKYADMMQAIDIGYMSDSSDESKMHVIEECIVRAISIHLSNLSESSKAGRVKMNVDYGFFYVSKVYDILSGRLITEKTLGQFVKDVLQIS